jgi:esterase/lipase
MQADSMKSKRETKKKEIEELEKELEKLRDVLEAISIETIVKHVREDRESR